MRDEVINELLKRIELLRTVAKPNDIETGMSGSFIRFNHYLQSHTAMTQDEFNCSIYDDWLKEQFEKVYKEINKEI